MLPKNGPGQTDAVATAAVLGWGASCWLWGQGGTPVIPWLSRSTHAMSDCAGRAPYRHRVLLNSNPTALKLGCSL